MGNTIQYADRLTQLPPYLFVAIDQAKQEALKKGRDVIDLGIGDPDMPTPGPIIERLCSSVHNSARHRYPSNKGLSAFRQAIARWYKRRFGVVLDPEKEILPLIGSKEGIAHFPLVFLNPGDEALVPDPGYPPYRNGVILAGGRPYTMPLLEENNFLPDLENIDPQVAERAKIMFLNSPNNPTASCASVDYFEDIIAFARRYDIIVAHDGAYSELYYDNYKPVSFLEIAGAREVGVEFHSLSKTYNMTGWRVGFAVGNAAVIEGLAKVKSNIDSGVFEAIQEAGITALDEVDKELGSIRKVYQERRDVLVDGLNRMNWKVDKPLATFYVWIKVPPGYTSMEIATIMLQKADIIVTPGVGFGENGEGYIRIALTVDTPRLEEVLNRIERLKW